MSNIEGFPVHWAQLGRKWTSLGEDGCLEYSMDLESQLLHLQEDGAFKKAVLAELEEDVDLKAATRSYMESISNVQETVREMIAEPVKSSRALMEDAHRQYGYLYSGSLVGLSAVKWSGERQVSQIPLLLDWDDIRIKLQKRNAKIVNLRKRYVTGRIRATKNKEK